MEAESYNCLKEKQRNPSPPLQASSPPIGFPDFVMRLLHPSPPHPPPKKKRGEVCDQKLPHLFRGPFETQMGLSQNRAPSNLLVFLFDNLCNKPHKGYQKMTRPNFKQQPKWEHPISIRSEFVDLGLTPCSQNMEVTPNWCQRFCPFESHERRLSPPKMASHSSPDWWRTVSGGRIHLPRIAECLLEPSCEFTGSSATQGSAEDLQRPKIRSGG